MGHVRLGKLPRTRKWQQVVALVGGGGRWGRSRRRVPTRRTRAFAMQRITQDEYDKKARELKARQVELAMQIEQHQQGDGAFRTALESLISVASRAAEIFERSKVEQKR